MLGKRCGVAIQIYKKQPKAHYTHCHRHSLNLSIKDATRSSKMLSDVMDTTAENSVLIKFSPKHEKLLENLKEKIKIVSKAPQIKSQNFLPQDGQ